MTVGCKLQPDQRAALLARCAWRFGHVVADHVTLVPAARGGALPEATQAPVVGRADDGVGVEALVVEIGGTTQRLGGGTYHITWSLAEGRAARESNEVIAAGGWIVLELDADALTLDLVPARW